MVEDKYKYEKKYDKFIPQITEYCEKNIPIRFKDVSKLIGINVKIISNIIRANKIPHTLFRKDIVRINKKTKNVIIKKYLEGKSTLQLGKEYGVRGSRIGKILHANNIKLREKVSKTIKYNIERGKDYDLKEITKQTNIKYKDLKLANSILKENKIDYKIVVNDPHIKFEFKCPECGGVSLKLPRSIKINVFICNACVEKHRSDIQAGLKKIRVNNKSGYIGVCVGKNRKKEPIRYQVKLTYHNKFQNIYINLFKIFNDSTLSNKTLMEAVVYRDKYIIENNLPHARNLDNNELISNMEMLGQYEEVQKIKLLLGI